MGKPLGLFRKRPFCVRLRGGYVCLGHVMPVGNNGLFVSLMRDCFKWALLSGAETVVFGHC